MNKQEFIERLDNIRRPLSKEFSSFLYMIASDVMNISHMEKQVESLGYTTKRERYPGNGYMIYSTILWEGKEIGVIENQGLPSIMVDKRKRAKHARKFVDLDGAIEPIKGVHRVLAWHDTEGKLHKLAGGQTVINFMPVEITREAMIDFLTKTKLIDKVDEFKEGEDERLQKAVDKLNGK